VRRRHEDAIQNPEIPENTLHKNKMRLPRSMHMEANLLNNIGNIRSIHLPVTMLA
jgi:hypothetical protein